MKLWKIAASACAAGVLAMGAVPATAGMQPDVGLVGTGGSAVPGGTAFTNMTVTFKVDYNFVGVDLEGFFDASKLSFEAAQSSVNLMGTSYDLPSFMAALAGLQLSSGGDFMVLGNAGPGTMSLHAGYVDGLSSQLLPAGDISVTLAFKILPSVAVGTVSDVTFTQIAVADVNEMTPLAWDDNHVVLSVTAVPEPESWLMMLAGVGLLGAVAHRRRAASA